MAPYAKSVQHATHGGARQSKPVNDHPGCLAAKLFPSRVHNISMEPTGTIAPLVMWRTAIRLVHDVSGSQSGARYIM